MSGGELTPEQRTQVRERDYLVRAAMLAVDSVVLDPQVQSALEYAPRAVNNRAAVTAAIGFLVANGYTHIPEGEEGRWLPISVPEHLWPDVDAMVEGNRQLRDIFFPGLSGPPAPRRNTD